MHPVLLVWQPPDDVLRNFVERDRLRMRRFDQGFPGITGLSERGAEGYLAN